MFLLQEKIDYSGNCFIQHPINLYTLTYLQDIGKDNPAVIYQFLKHFTFTMSRINGDFFFIYFFLVMKPQYITMECIHFLFWQFLSSSVYC